VKTKMFAAMTVLFLGASLVADVSVGEASAANAILIDFSSKSCPPCRAMEPVLADLENAGVPVRHVDVRTEQDLARRYGIRQTPTYVVIADGKEVTRLVGMQSIEQLRSALAINPAGPLVPTGAKSNSLDDYPTPRTRLAPMKQLLEGHQTLTTALPASSSPAFTPEAMPSVNLADAIERAKAATVRLRVYDGRGFGAGTGTIVDTHGDEALVLTCGHLFRETKGEGKIEVDLFIGGEIRTVLGQVIDYDADDRDIGLVAIRPGFPVIPVEVLSNQTKVRTGQTAFSFGCDRGDDPSRRDTRITGIDKYNQQLGVSNLEIEGAPIDGRSGGGLFDDAGRLIGVCNAADYKGDVGIYAGPGNIYWQFDRVKLERLYNQPQQNQPVATPERIASLDNESFAATGLPSSALQASATAPIGGDREVIVIIRDRNDPSSNSQVMTVAQPTAEFMQMVQQYAR